MPSIFSIRTLLRHAGVLLVAALAAGPILAQDWVGRGRLEGTVETEAGDPVEGATVTLLTTGDEGGGPDPLTTNEKGRWSYLGLGGGSWRVIIEKEGFVSSEGVVSITEFGRNPTVKVTLREIPREALVSEALLAARDMLDEGNALLHEQRFAEARAKYEGAMADIEDEEYHPMIYQAIAQTHMGENEPEKAVVALDRALALLPEEPTLMRLKAQALYEADETEGSIAVLETLVERDRADQTIDEPDTLQLLIDLLVRAEREDEAEAYLALMPEGAKVNPETLLNTGIDAFNDGDIEKAVRYFDQAVQENPDLADCYYYRALAYLNQEKTAEAAADFRTFVEMEPDHPKAEEARQFLEYLD